jgi:hypothetical protein
MDRDSTTETMTMSLNPPHSLDYRNYPEGFYPAVGLLVALTTAILVILIYHEPVVDEY